ANWDVNGTPQDNPRWSILGASDPNGSAHSGLFAWRFGFVSNNTTSPVSPSWRTLTTPSVNLSRPSFLIFYQRYDFTNSTDRESNGTGGATVEVRYGGGVWTPIARVSGAAPSWTGVSIGLLPASLPTTIQVRFNATSGNMPTRGGWWIDDVAIADRGLDRSAVLLPTTMSLNTTAGGVVPGTVKLVNVGDSVETFVLDSSVPAGWALRWVPIGGIPPLATTRPPRPPDAKVISTPARFARRVRDARAPPAGDRGGARVPGEHRTGVPRAIDPRRPADGNGQDGHRRDGHRGGPAAPWRSDPVPRADQAARRATRGFDAEGPRRRPDHALHGRGDRSRGSRTPLDGEQVHRIDAPGDWES